MKNLDKSNGIGKLSLCRSVALSLCRSVALSLVAGSALTGCFAPPQPPILTTINVPSFKVHDQSEITKDGLTVSIQPVMDDTVRSLSQLYKVATYKTTRPATNLFGQPDPTQPPVPVEGKIELSIVPLPCFKVQVANHTGHVLRFTQVVFRLQSGTGQSYPLFAGTSEIEPWLDNVLNSNPQFGPAIAKQVMPEFKRAINGLPLLTRTSQELLDGDVWNGYLVFNMNISTAKDYNDFLAATERLSLRLAEMPIAYTDAGAVSKTTEFTFVIDKMTAPLRVKCPAGTQEPSVTVCSKEM